MPSISRKQAKLMRIAAHKPGGFGGVPQSVGREFSQADKRKRAMDRIVNRRRKQGY